MGSRGTLKMVALWGGGGAGRDGDGTLVGRGRLGVDATPVEALTDLSKKERRKNSHQLQDKKQLSLYLKKTKPELVRRGFFGTGEHPPQTFPFDAHHYSGSHQCEEHRQDTHRHTDAIYPRGRGRGGV